MRLRAPARRRPRRRQQRRGRGEVDGSCPCPCSTQSGLKHPLKTVKSRLRDSFACVEGYAFSSLDELGEGYGFRKIRQALGVEAFGVNAVVMPPGYEGFYHYHD